MKKLTALTTALALAICLAPSYAAAEAAQGGDCVYPSDFISSLQFKNLADYAVCGDTHAYAESTNLFVISPDKNGDNQLTSTDCGFQITDIDYDEEGNLYLKSTDNSVYSYPSLTPAQYSFQSNITLKTEQYEYRLTAQTGELFALDNENILTTIFEQDCSHLKEYDGEVYIMNGGKVYLLDGLSPVELAAEYTDFSAADSIYKGDADSILAAEYEVRTVTLRPTTADGGDTYVTMIDLDAEGETFLAGKTQKITGDRSALALCDVGNATIIVMADENGLSRSYITLTAAVEDSDYSAPANDMAHACARTELKIYSRPYMCEATAISTLPAGTIFTVIEKFELRYLKETYYRVQCEIDGQKTEGFVAAGMLSPYSFSTENEDENTTGKNEFEYGDVTETVIIILLIILLVLVAAGYVIFYMTKKGEGNVRRRKKAPPKDDDAY